MDRHSIFENLNYMSTDSELQSYQEYVESNIKAIDCGRYVVGKIAPFCFCGRLKEEHQEKFSNSNDGEWKKDQDLKPFPTNAHGEMRLTGFRAIAGMNPKFIRASLTPDVDEHLYLIMTKYWNIRPPELIISINGGAKKMQPLGREQKHTFKMGLRNISNSASTWVVTGGFNFGVSSLVGEASKDHSIGSQEKMFTVLGIGTWGATFNRHLLEIERERQSESSEKLNEDSKDTKIIYPSSRGKDIGKGQAPLDPYHDAFILIDTGIERKFGEEIEFRAKFETFASKKANCSVVQLIMEGGKKCIQTAAESLKSGTPVILMKGSGRAADVICEVLESSDDMVQKTIKDQLAKFEKEWSVSDKEKQTLPEDLENIRDGHRNKLVHIFNMSDFSSALDTAILQAAFSAKINGKEIDSTQKMKLLMTFNRPDLAKELIMNDTEFDILQYPEFIETALIKNQWKFMDIFIAKGLTVESFLTKDMLHRFYFDHVVKKQTLSTAQSMLRILKDRYAPQNMNKNNLGFVGFVIKSLSKNIMPNIYEERKPTTRSCIKNVQVEDSNKKPTEAYKITDSEKYIEPIIVNEPPEGASCICCSGNTASNLVKYKYTRYPPKNRDGCIIYTEQDLLFWALITQKYQMAKIFWRCGKDHIGSALLASVILNSMSSVALKEGEMELFNQIDKCRKEFLELAISILTEAYWRDKIRAHLLLIRALPYISRKTCFDIAERDNIIDFVFHSACQTRLNAVWLGGMSPYTSTAKIVVNLLFGFLTSKALIFSGSSGEKYSDMEKPQAKGIAPDLMPDNTNVKEMTEDVAVPTKANMLEDQKKPRDYLSTFRNKHHTSWKNISFCKAVAIFYNAPITKFIMNMISFIFFLGFYTYCSLVEYKPLSQVTSDSNRALEYVTYCYVITMFLEEVRKLSMGSSDGIKDKLHKWIRSWWNIFEIIIYITFILAFILRYIPNIDFVYARTAFAFALSFFYFKFLEFYYVHESIGPQVVMISRMLRDIAFFLAIFILGVFSYGTFAQALLYSNSPLNAYLFKNIMYYPYWQSFGDLHLDYVEGSNSQGTVSATPNGMVIVAFAIFMLFSNTMLMNLLVALFSRTFDQVEENSNRIWAFQRYKIIEEYYWRPVLPPPFNIFELIYLVFKSSNCCVSGPTRRPIDEFVVNLTHEEDLQSSGFEQQCMETYLLDHPLLDEQQQKAGEKSNLAFSILPSSKASIDSQPTSDINPDTMEIINTINSGTNDLRNEIKLIDTKLHKIRRHQKRNRQSEKSFIGRTFSEKE